MGGGESSSQPYDALGGQYASFSGGTPPSDYSWLTALGKGVEAGARTYGSESQSHANYETGSPGYPQQNNSGLNVGSRQQEIALDERIFDSKKQQDLALALQRLFAEKQKPIVPDTGAAKYWYVDPRAQTNYALPEASQLYGTPQGQNIGF